MCPGIPAQLVGGDTGHPDLAMADMGGVHRVINMGLLEARLALDGSAVLMSGAHGIAPGDWVSLHWDWICDRLTQRQLRALRGFTVRHLDLVNHRVEHPGTVAVLG